MSTVGIIVLLVFFAVILAFIGILRWLAEARKMGDRLLNTVGAVTKEETGNSLRDVVNSQLRGTSMAAKIERQLIAADSKFTVAEFLMIRMGLTLMALLLGWLISGYLLGGVLLAIIGWGLPAFYLRRQQNQRLKAFADQLPDFLNLLVSSLRAGYGLLHALTVVKDEMPDPIATEFSRVLREISLGYSVGEALDHLVDRIDNSDLELIVTSIHIQSEVGGNLAEVMETIAHTIRERIQINNEISVMTTQQRATGGILSAMPFIIGAILMLINGEYMMEMFQPTWVLIIPATAVVLIVMGNFVMQLMMKIEV